MYTNNSSRVEKVLKLVICADQESEIMLRKKLRSNELQNNIDFNNVYNIIDIHNNNNNIPKRKKIRKKSNSKRKSKEKNMNDVKKNDKINDENNCKYNINNGNDIHNNKCNKNNSCNKIKKCYNECKIDDNINYYYNNMRNIDINNQYNKEKIYKNNIYIPSLKPMNKIENNNYVNNDNFINNNKFYDNNIDYQPENILTNDDINYILSETSNNNISSARRDTLGSDVIIFGSGYSGNYFNDPLYQNYILRDSEILEKHKKLDMIIQQYEQYNKNIDDNNDIKNENNNVNINNKENIEKNSNNSNNIISIINNDKNMNNVCINDNNPKSYNNQNDDNNIMNNNITDNKITENDDDDSMHFELPEEDKPNPEINVININTENTFKIEENSEYYNNETNKYSNHRYSSSNSKYNSNSNKINNSNSIKNNSSNNNKNNSNGNNKSKRSNNNNNDIKKDINKEILKDKSELNDIENNIIKNNNDYSKLNNSYKQNNIIETIEIKYKSKHNKKKAYSLNIFDKENDINYTNIKYNNDNNNNKQININDNNIDNINNNEIIVLDNSLKSDNNDNIDINSDIVNFNNNNYTYDKSSNESKINDIATFNINNNNNNRINNSKNNSIINNNTTTVTLNVTTPDSKIKIKRYISTTENNSRKKRNLNKQLSFNSLTYDVNTNKYRKTNKNNIIKIDNNKNNTIFTPFYLKLNGDDMNTIENITNSSFSTLEIQKNNNATIESNPHINKIYYIKKNKRSNSGVINKNKNKRSKNPIRNDSFCVLHNNKEKDNNINDNKIYKNNKYNNIKVYSRHCKIPSNFKIKKLIKAKEIKDNDNSTNNILYQNSIDINDLSDECTDRYINNYNKKCENKSRIICNMPKYTNNQYNIWSQKIYIKKSPKKEKNKISKLRRHSCNCKNDDIY